MFLKDERVEVKKLPLLSVDDWLDQLLGLVSNCKSEQRLLGEEETGEISWCVVSNGGCTSIALEVSRRLSSVNNSSSLAPPRYPLTHLVLSATPSTESLFSPVDLPEGQKSYRTLSRRAVGGLFWWYSLRNEGVFIQKFSEKNLMARPENIGKDWRPRCYATAKAFEGKSRYSTFAFLAGSLNGGNGVRLDDLIRWNKGNGSDNKSIGVAIIIGGEMKGKAARSWFWKRRPKVIEDEKTRMSMTEQTNPKDPNDRFYRNPLNELPPPRATFTAYLRKNGFRCTETIVGGRFCPAHEDARGYARAVMGLLVD